MAAIVLGPSAPSLGPGSKFCRASAVWMSSVVWWQDRGSQRYRSDPSTRRAWLEPLGRRRPGGRDAPGVRAEAALGHALRRGQDGGIQVDRRRSLRRPRLKVRNHRRRRTGAAKMPDHRRHTAVRRHRPKTDLVIRLSVQTRPRHRIPPILTQQVNPTNPINRHRRTSIPQHQKQPPGMGPEREKRRPSPRIDSQSRGALGVPGIHRTDLDEYTNPTWRD